MTSNTEHIIELIHKTLSGEATNEELAEVTLWIEGEPANRQFYDDIKRIWEKSSAVKELNDINVNEEWKKFYADIKGSGRVIKLNRYKFISIAASILVVLGLAQVFLFPKTLDKTVTAENEIEEITLPDLSKVTLNIGSEIQYSRLWKFNKTRELALSGEAFFNVTRDTLKPFRIHVKDATIEVLGTSFNVRSFPNDKEVTVVVNSGKVALKSSVLSKSVVLKKGEKGIYSAETKILDSFAETDVNYLSWKTKEFNFTDIAFDQIVETLAHAYNAKIIVKNDGINACTVNADFKNMSLESVLLILSETIDFEWDKTSKGYIISGKGCQP